MEMNRRKSRKTKNYVSNEQQLSKEQNDLVNEQIKNLLQENQKLTQIVTVQKKHINEIERNFKLVQSNNGANIEIKTVLSKIKSNLSMANDVCENVMEKNNKEQYADNKNCDIKASASKQSTHCRPSSAPNNTELLTTQLTIVKTKLFDALNQNNQLKNDLKIAQKCIQQEIGEHISLATLIGANSTWRGRAQQIAVLQDKVNELMKPKDRNERDSTVIELRRLESSRRIDQEQMLKDLKFAKEIIEENKVKINALRVRNKILYDENFSLRQKKRNLEDTQRIQEIKYVETDKALNELKVAHNTDITNIIKQKSILHEQKIKCELDNGKKELLINELNEIIQNKDDQIEKLNKDLKAVCGDFLFNCKDFKMNEYMAILDVLQTEKDNLLNHIKLLNKRLDNEQEKLIKFQDEFGKTKLKYAKLDQIYRRCLRDKDELERRTKRTLRISSYSKTVNTAPTSSTSITAATTTDVVTSENFEMKFKIDDLTNKLDVANERICFLEDNIREFQQEQQEDVEIFAKAMSKSKYTLAEQMLEKNKNDYSE